MVKNMINTRQFQKKCNLWGWIFSVPSVISVLICIVYPTVFSIYLSMTNMKFSIRNVKIIGLENFQWLFSERGINYWNSILVSAKFTVYSTIVQITLGFLLAYLLYNMSPKLQSIYKVLVYIPVLLPAAVVSVMWQFIYQPQTGLADRILSVFGVTNFPGWISDIKYALNSVIFTNTWRYVGITIILYFVAMNAIPKEVVESASIDGANKMQLLRHLIVPMTFNSTKMNIVISVIGGLKSFDLMYLLTKGMAGTETVGLHIYRTGFEYRTFARAIAMGVVLSVIIGIITVLLNKFSPKEE